MVASAWIENIEIYIKEACARMLIGLKWCYTLPSSMLS